MQPITVKGIPYGHTHQFGVLQSTACQVELILAPPGSSHVHFKMFHLFKHWCFLWNFKVQLSSKAFMGTVEAQKERRRWKYTGERERGSKGMSIQVDSYPILPMNQEQQQPLLIAIP